MEGRRGERRGARRVEEGRSGAERGRGGRGRERDGRGVWRVRGAAGGEREEGGGGHGTMVARGTSHRKSIACSMASKLLMLYLGDFEGVSEPPALPSHYGWALSDSPRSESRTLRWGPGWASGGVPSSGTLAWL